jgi:hypothetical protein
MSRWIGNSLPGAIEHDAKAGKIGDTMPSMQPNL